MGILSVHALEIDTLTVDEHDAGAYLYVTKTIFCRKHHFFFAGSILLTDDYGIEIRSLCCPRKKRGETVKFNA